MNASLADTATMVADAFQLAPQTPFVPENVVFGEYTFLPWVRDGLAAVLTAPAPDALRATVSVSLAVLDESGGRRDVSNTLTLRGPGDILGLDPAQIVRRFPNHGTISAEENMLAHIEFDRPDLPWLFSPHAPAGDRLPPWLALVVCEAAVSTLQPGPAGLPARLLTRRGQLQSLADSWAWAHAQILGNSAGAPSVADRLSASFGPTNLSRVLCPRKLSPNRSYIAALVPAFDCGVQAALGKTGGTLGPAWIRAADGSDAEVEIVLPVFDTWQFSTAPAGDFEKLAGKLHGMSAPWNVGRRLIDMSQPRGHLDPLAADAPGAVQVLRCALVSPTPMPPELPPESSAWDAPQRDLLRQEIDRANAAGQEDLPRVGPRLYARFQRGQPALGAVFGEPATDTSAADGDWFSQLNTAPLHRIVAGLGTRVVQKDQEPLMQAAWQQVGEIRKVNEALARLQFGRYVGEALQRNHLAKLPLGDLAQVTRGVQAKVLSAGAAATFHGVVARSAVAPAALTAAFRRVARLRGPLTRFAGREGLAGLRQIVANGARFQDFRRAYVEPEGVRTLSVAARAAISPALLARKLGVREAEAPEVFAQRLAARRAGVPVADRLAQPVGSWRIPDGKIDIGDRAASRIVAQVDEALPTRFTGDTARVEALAPLLVGIVNSALPEVSARANSIVGRIGARLPFSPVPPAHGLPVNLGAATAGRVGIEARGAARAGAGALTLKPRLRFESDVSRKVTATVGKSRAVSFIETATALSQLVLGNGVAALPRTPDRPALAFTREALLAAVAPAANVTAYAKSRLGQLPSWLAPDWFDDSRIAPIMAAPRFDRAMFEALDAYDRNWLIPGLGSIPFTDFVTVLTTNPAFTEAFLTGLSDEMGRELLWRGYPTDQRGTYFHRFWDHAADELKKEIHRFPRTPLGSHLADAGGAEGRVVLVVRGEVVRRYPDAVFLALRAGGSDAQGRPVFIDPADDPTATARVLFHNHLAPDILLVGFHLLPSQIRNEPWWFIIAENPSAPRFGLDLEDPPSSARDGVKRDALDWNDLGPLTDGRFLSAQRRTLRITEDGASPVTWPGHAGDVAHILLQNPVRAAFDARKLIAPALPTP